MAALFCAIVSRSLEDDGREATALDCPPGFGRREGAAPAFVELILGGTLLVGLRAESDAVSMALSFCAALEADDDVGFACKKGGGGGEVR